MGFPSRLDGTTWADRDTRETSASHLDHSRGIQLSPPTRNGPATGAVRSKLLTSAGFARERLNRYYCTMQNLGVRI